MEQIHDQSLLEEKIDTQYADLVATALQQNDINKVLDLKWGRLFLTQTYGYWVG